MPLTEERMIRIQLEETRGSNRTPDREEEERDFRRGVAADISKMRKAGVEIVVPNTQPDLSET